MKSNPKVLVASATYKGMGYCDDEFLKSVKNFKGDYDILIVEKSEDSDYFNELRKIEGVEVLKYDSDEKDKLIRVIESRNMIIEHALKNNYDYILMLDSDVIAPENIIEELLDCEKEIVSGWYVNYAVVDGVKKIIPAVWLEVSEKEFEEMKRQVNFPDFVKSHEDLRRRIEDEEIKSRKVIKVLIPAGGYMMLSRKVFEKIKYNLIDTSNWGDIKTSDEIGFVLKAMQAGFESWCNTRVKCEHLIEGKFEKRGKFYNHPIYE